MNIDGRLTDIVARSAPWLSPLPTAYMTGLATVRHFEWPLVMGVVTGAIVETVGISAVNTALEIYTHNRGVGNDEKMKKWQAPLWLALALTAVYFISVTLLVVLLDVFPEWVHYAPIIFPLLSITGVTLIAVRIDQRRRVDAMIMSRVPPYNIKRYDGRREELAAEAGQVPERQTILPASKQNPIVVVPAPSGNGDGKRMNYDEFCRQHRDIAGMTGDDVAEIAGITPRTGRNWLAKRKAAEPAAVAGAGAGA